MEFITALKLLSMASSSFISSSKEEKAREAAKDYLMSRYRLTQYRHIGASWALVGGSGGFYAYNDEWLRAVTNVLHKITHKSDVDEELYVLCGELAMFITVLGNDPLDEKRNPRPLFEKFQTLQGTETYVSLLEMGRGRGSDYALKLIKNELHDIYA